jgi:hypothetical protein
MLRGSQEICNLFSEDPWIGCISVMAAFKFTPSMKGIKFYSK